MPVPTGPVAPAAPAPIQPIPAMRKGRLTYAMPDEIEYDIVHPSHTYTETSNLIPAFGTMKGARLFMSSKYLSQALPMKEPESPLVDARDDESGGFYGNTIGTQLGVTKSGFDGVIKKVLNDRIVIQGPDKKNTEVELRHMFPHNRKTFTTDYPLVKPGDTVKKGQALAHSNYVTKEGDLALGKNLRVAFMPGPEGKTFEDAITVSEDAAKKLTSTHLYGFDVENKLGTQSNKAKFMQLFPNKYTKDQLAKIGDNGMALPGVALEPGDPIFLSFGPRSLRADDRAKGNLHKIMRKSFVDKSQIWEKASPGTVADAVTTKGGHSINIATEVPLKVGDKISGRYAAKGVVAQIVGNDRMFKDSEGNTVDILINPAALIGRVNVGMVYESLLGKIAQKTGKRYALPAFSSDSFHDFVQNELQRNNVKDTEDLFDPVSGKKVPSVLTGLQYFLKLEHTADSKLSAIDEGRPDQNEQPGKPGGSESAKRIGNLDVTALLSHGAVANLHDIQNYRSGANPDMWRRIRLGLPLPAPKTPFIYEKFINTLKAAGINPTKSGSKIQLKALKRSDLNTLTEGREVQNAETIDSKNGQPVPGGLMDLAIHGVDGKEWSHIKLDEEMPNPILEEPLRRLLNLSEPAMRDILAGQGRLNGRTGPQALKEAAKGVDLDRLEEDLRSTIRNGTKTARNEAVKRLNVVAGMKRQGLEVDDLFTDKIPVLPPSYRPVSMAGKMMLSADSNYLYKDLMTSRDLFRQSKEVLGEDEAGQERLALYDSMAAVQGLGDPIHPKTQQKGVKGFIRSLSGGGGPKTGMFLSKVVGHTVNTVGRGVIIPDSDLDMDSVGVPERMAWRLYSPFVMRAMVQAGMPAQQAALNVERKTDFAKNFLLKTMEKRPVMYNRAPALHRYSMMSAYPRLVTGDSIQLSPLVVKGFNADFDGDAMNIHVPISDEAVKEAIDKLLPSKNLLGIKDMKINYAPSQEFILGLYNSTVGNPKKEKRRFKDDNEVLQAYRRGEIDIDSPVEIGG